MPIYNYKCEDCLEINQLFNDEEIKCCKCNSLKLKRIFSMPSKNSNMETGDKFYNTKSIVGVKEELHKRHVDHVLKTLPDTIDQVGEKVAKEMGWIDKNGKMVDKFNYEERDKNRG